MDARRIDTSAVSGRTALHRSSSVSKLLALTAVMAAVVVQNDVLVVTAVAGVLAAVVLGTRLPGRLAFALASYPALFALVFAFAGAPDALTGALFVAKATTAALAVVTVMLTTPYPQVFAPLQAITPRIVGDAMLMTYRSLFLLAGQLSDLMRAVRLRAGVSFGRPVRAARATVTALGPLLLYAFDLSQRSYDVMRLRGYTGRLRAAIPPSSRPAVDAALLAGSLLILVTAAVWRLWPRHLGPFSWIPLSAAVLALAGALTWRWTRR